MSQVSTSVEVLLKIRQIGEELVAKTKRDMDALAATQGKVAAGAPAVEAANKKTAASFVALGKSALGLVGAYQALGLARRAIAASNEAERAELRTLGVLQAQFDTREKALKQLERYKALSRDVAGRLGVFDDDALLGALGRFSVVNPAFANERSLQAAADLAVVKFGGNFDAAAEALADSFVGIGRGLQDVLPELRALSGDEQQRLLKRGGAVGLIESSFGGASGVFRDSDLGRQLEASVQFENAMEIVGESLKRVLAPAAVIAAAGLIRVAEGSKAFETAKRQAFGLLSTFIGGGASLRDPDFIRGSAEFVRDNAGLYAALSSAAEGVGLRGARGLVGGIRAQADRVLGIDQGGPDGGPRGDPNRLLERSRINELLGGSGALGSFEQRVLELRRQFEAIQTSKGDLPFEAPGGGLGASIANAERDIDLLYNLSLARERAAQTAETLARAQEELNRSVARTSELVQTKSISEAAGRQANEEAAERFRKVVEEARAAREETALFASETTEKLRAFTDLALPGEPRFITDLTDSIEGAERALESLSRRAQGLSQELSKRLEQPFANLIVATVKGQAGLDDFLQTFLDTNAQIASEEASRGILRAIFGGLGGSTLFGGLFDNLGAAFGYGGGFAHGGLVPGADRGRDTTFIAARGQEFVLTPGAARAIGHRRLDSINRAYGGRRSSGASYAGGGLVDVVAAMGGAPGNGTAGGAVAVLPVLPTDRDTITRLFSGENAMVVAELLARHPSARRALANAIGASR